MSSSKIFLLFFQTIFFSFYVAIVLNAILSVKMEKNWEGIEKTVKLFWFEKMEEHATRTIIKAWAYRSTCFLRHELQSDSLLQKKKETRP
jgi:hypothetical protein